MNVVVSIFSFSVEKQRAMPKMLLPVWRVIRRQCQHRIFELDGRQWRDQRPDSSIRAAQESRSMKQCSKRLLDVVPEHDHFT